MSTKEEILELISNLPDNVTLDEVMEKLYIRAKIEAAVNEIDQGKGISHEDVKEHFKKWLN
jgi:predicted transcriptional regulator